MEETKTCKGECSKEKPLSEFSVSRTYQDKVYYKSVCRRCTNIKRSNKGKIKRTSNYEKEKRLLEKLYKEKEILDDKINYLRFKIKPVNRKGINHKSYQIPFSNRTLSLVKCIRLAVQETFGIQDDYFESTSTGKINALAKVLVVYFVEEKIGFTSITLIADLLSKGRASIGRYLEDIEHYENNNTYFLYVDEHFNNLVSKVRQRIDNYPLFKKYSYGKETNKQRRNKSVN